VTKGVGGDPLTIWVDKETHLLRQSWESHEFGAEGFSTEQTTTYMPTVNGTIDAGELAFNPPMGAAEPSK
jgi:hypothetical protein